MFLKLQMKPCRLWRANFGRAEQSIHRLLALHNVSQMLFLSVYLRPNYFHRLNIKLSLSCLIQQKIVDMNRAGAMSDIEYRHKCDQIEQL